MTPSKILTGYALQRLSDWVQAVTGARARRPGVRWSREDYPSWGVQLLPGTWDDGWPSRSRRTVSTAWTLSTAAANALDPIAVALAGETVIVAPSATPEAGRDALLTGLRALRLEVDGWITLTADGATEILVTTAEGWAPPLVEGLQQVEVTPTAEETADLVVTPYLLRARVQGYGMTVEQGIAALAALRREVTISRPPFVRGIGEPQHVPVRSGADPDDRVFVDVTMGLRELYRRTVPALAGVVVTVSTA